MTPMRPVPRNKSSDDTALDEFRALCAKMRKEGRQLPEQHVLDTEFTRYERRANPEFHRQLLRTRVMTLPLRKQPNHAARQLADELKEATGRDFSAGDVSLGSIFSAAARGRGR